MRKVAVNLHVHESSASKDASASYNDMVESYREQLEIPFRLGVVGHDKLPKVDLRREDIKGIERTIDKSEDLHIINFPRFNFKILAHPRYTWSENTKKKAKKAIKEHNVDAVEKFNAGNKQFEGDLPATHVAGDDSHNRFQTGVSFMVIESHNPASLTWEIIFDKIKRGKFEMVSENTPVRYAFGQALKGLTILGSDV